MSAVNVGMAIGPVSRRGCASSSRRGINLVAGGVAHGDCGSVAFLADDENPRDALQAVEIDYVERGAVTVRLQNVPGAGAATFRRLLAATSSTR